MSHGSQSFVCVSVCLSVLCTCFCLVLCIYSTLRWFSVSEWWGAGVVICLERDADLHMVQLMPLPLTVSCFSKIQIGFTFLVPAHLGSPGQRAVKRVCVGGRGGFQSKLTGCCVCGRETVIRCLSVCVCVCLVRCVYSTLRWYCLSTPRMLVSIVTLRLNVSVCATLLDSMPTR